MQNLVRREVVDTARTLVVKIGTNVLSKEDGSLDVERLRSLAEQIHRIHVTGRRVVIVSSGAVGAGMSLLSLKERPKDLPHLQAAAATGQAHLIRLYDDCLRPHGYHAAQLLLTGNDFKTRARYLNVRNTLHTLFEYGAVPIINENDTVSVAEIKFGDNDQLAAMVTNLLSDPLLVILSVVDGLYVGDPSAPGAKPIPLVDRWNESLLTLVAPSRSSRGTGGMQSKLSAVRMATAVGENVIIANGTWPNVLDRIMGERKSAPCFWQREKRSRPGSGGSATPSVRGADCTWMKALVGPSPRKADRCWRSGSLRWKAILRKANSSRSWMPPATKSPEASRIMPLRISNKSEASAPKKSPAPWAASPTSKPSTGTIWCC